jgi:hypothetical protein
MAKSRASIHAVGSGTATPTEILAFEIAPKFCFYAA